MYSVLPQEFRRINVETLEETVVSTQHDICFMVCVLVDNRYLWVLCNNPLGLNFSNKITRYDLWDEEGMPFSTGQTVMQNNIASKAINWDFGPNNTIWILNSGGLLGITHFIDVYEIGLDTVTLMATFVQDDLQHPTGFAIFSDTGPHFDPSAPTSDGRLDGGMVALLVTLSILLVGGVIVGTVLMVRKRKKKFVYRRVNIPKHNIQ